MCTPAQVTFCMCWQCRTWSVLFGYLISDNALSASVTPSESWYWNWTLAYCTKWSCGTPNVNAYQTQNDLLVIWLTSSLWVPLYFIRYRVAEAFCSVNSQHELQQEVSFQDLRNRFELFVGAFGLGTAWRYWWCCIRPLDKHNLSTRLRDPVACLANPLAQCFIICNVPCILEFASRLQTSTNLRCS